MRYIKNNEKDKNRVFPKTCYLFIESFGRNMEEDMNEIANLQGYEDWFAFEANWDRKPQGLFQEFQLEMQKHSKFGREFEGSILINVVGLIDEIELGNILDYLKEREDKVSFIISVTDNNMAVQVREVMNGSFYTRTIEGKNYEVKEQIEILENELERYGFIFNKGEMEEIYNYLLEVTWKEEEHVIRKLQNVAKKMVYERMMEEEYSTTFGIKELKAALKEMHMESKKIKMGFLIEV